MNKTQLITALRAHLADKEDIANEAAPALALMRYAVVELEKPTSGGTDVDAVEVANLRRDLASSEKYVAELVDALNDREGLLYSLLADFGMVPEVDDEPVDSLREAMELQPDILDALQDKISIINASQVEADEDKDRFIDGVRKLLDGESLSLQGLWDALETASTRYASLENGIDERDQQIAEADKRLSRVDTLERIIVNACKAAGMPGGIEIGSMPFYALEERIKQLAQQGEAWGATVGERYEGSMSAWESIIGECLGLVGLEWEHVHELPRQIGHLKANPPAGSWVTDAIDLSHAVRGNLAPENRIMAKAAEAIIRNAPGVNDA